MRVQSLGEWGPWAANDASRRLLAHWQEAGRALGLEIRGEERGGLSDGNWTWQHIPTIDGLGPVGGNAHCSERSEDGSKDQEYILPASYPSKAQLSILALSRLVDAYFQRDHRLFECPL